MNRRTFLTHTTLAAGGALVSPAVAAAPASPPQNKRKTILLRSSWQDVNIGDQGHTPGTLRLLRHQRAGR